MTLPFIREHAAAGRMSTFNILIDASGRINQANETQVFRTVILWENGEPKISWEPKLAPDEEAKRVYTEIGKTNLTDEGWTEISPSNRDGMRFFKVKVEMK
ncbi:MAG: hypothetical protein ILM98_09505 [Kiritimatiellae bacterium]|nr:hypothetical protein [Kiritimatiellia bacterium]